METLAMLFLVGGGSIVTISFVCKHFAIRTEHGKMIADGATMMDTETMAKLALDEAPEDSRFLGYRLSKL